MDLLSHPGKPTFDQRPAHGSKRKAGAHQVAQKFRSTGFARRADNFTVAQSSERSLKFGSRSPTRKPTWIAFRSAVPDAECSVPSISVAQIKSPDHPCSAEI